MHHTKIDLTTMLAIGSAAGVRPSGRFVAFGLPSREHAAEFATAAGHSAKMPAAIFPPNDETERPTHAASRGTYWSAAAYLRGADSKRVSLAPFLVDSSLLFRTRL